MEIIKVLITDDHQIIVDGIKSILSNIDGIEVIGEANNGRRAIELIQLLPVNIVLMDIDMPVMNGIEATKRIKKEFPQIKIIILSMHNEGSLIKMLISCGADGYVLKNSDQEELLSAIRKVNKGQKYFSPEVTISLADKPSSLMDDSINGHYICDLTEREIEILKLIADGYSNKEIGEKLFISHRTVDTHRTNLMKKSE